MRKTIAWIFTVVGAAGLLSGMYGFLRSFDDGEALGINSILVIFFLGMLSLGTTILKPEAKVYKIILGTVVVLGILLFIAGELQIV